MTKNDPEAPKANGEKHEGERLNRFRNRSHLKQRQRFLRRRVPERNQNNENRIERGVITASANRMREEVSGKLVWIHCWLSAGKYPLVQKDPRKTFRTRGNMDKQNLGGRDYLENITEMQP